jgi:hypothetical protein
LIWREHVDKRRSFLTRQTPIAQQVVTQLLGGERNGWTPGFVPEGRRAKRRWPSA